MKIRSELAVRIASKMTDSTKEEIKFYTEWSKLFMIALIAVIAGVISLLRNKDNSVTEYMLITAGFVTIFIEVIIIIYMTFRIIVIIKKGKNGDV